MPTVWLDAVYKPFFLKSHMTRVNNWRSIGRISWRMASFKSFNVLGLWALTRDFKYPPPPPPKKKITRWLIGRARGPRHVSETGNELPGKYVSNNGHRVCSVRCGTVLLKPHIGTVYFSSCQPPPPAYLPIQKMSGSHGSPCTYA